MMGKNTYGIRQKERNTNKKCVSCFLIRNVLHFYGLPLDLCGKRIAALFAKRAAIFYQRSAIWRNAPLFHGESAAWIAALYKMAHFQELQHTQRNRHNTRYAAIISAAAARFLHSF